MCDVVIELTKPYRNPLTNQLDGERERPIKASESKSITYGFVLLSSWGGRKT